MVSGLNMYMHMCIQHVYLPIYIYMCVYLCVCVCVCIYIIQNVYIIRLIQLKNKTNRYVNIHSVNKFRSLQKVALGNILETRTQQKM